VNRPAAIAAATVLLVGSCAGQRADSPIDAAADSPPPTFAPTTRPAPTFAPTTETTTATTTTSSTVEQSAKSAQPAPTGDLGPAIARLTLASEGDSTTYERELFGGDWIDADGDGCDTRCEVLAEERRTDLPGLPAGGWLSAFDGYSTDDPSELDIDHMVPLAEAWRSGANAWDGARRIAFANDLDHGGSLIAVTAAVNRSKGDRDPASWQPPNTEAWCSYVADWTNTKLRWNLTADEAEVRALRNMAGSQSC